ncbi:hypothetical protein [Streptomyces sp. NPDC005989]|uniref:hypothetical protein n=1 Tax=Streptomyces sp. NPDC005989 TaxID=3156727 RepID=UPI0033C852BA
MTARRLAPITTALLIASLVGCNPSATKSDSKPAAPASQPGKESAAPGAPAGGNDLSLAQAIAKIPSGTEDRAGYERDSFRL